MAFLIENNILIQYMPEPGETEVIIPDGVQEIADRAFLPVPDTELAPEKADLIMAGRYSEIQSLLRRVTIPEGVTRIGTLAFSGCKSLETVQLPSTLRVIENEAFFGCRQLQAVTLPDGLETLGECAFMRCGSLRSVTLPDSLRSIPRFAFHECRGLESLTLGSRTEEIGEMAFTRCEGLKAVRIPDSVVSIGHGAFMGCTSLADVTVPGTVRRIELRAFEDTPWLGAQEGLVMAGDHVLVSYNGSEQELRIPDEVKYFNCTMFDYGACRHVKTLFCRGITYQKHEQVLLGDMVRMVTEKEYGMFMYLPVKYPLLWQAWRLDPKQRKLRAFVEKSFDEMFLFAIREGLTAAAEAVCKDGKLLTAENIDKWIGLANAAGQYEIQLMLMNYKKEVLGFGEGDGLLL